MAMKPYYHEDDKPMFDVYVGILCAAIFLIGCAAAAAATLSYIFKQLHHG